MQNYLLNLFKFHYKYLIFTHCWCKLYNSSLIKKNNLKFNKKMNQLEDTNFNFEYMRFANKIGYLNKSYYLNEKRHNHISHINLKSLFCYGNKHMW